ncbi:MAG: hypothetical protein ACK55Z_35065, partial [bacterium]
RVRAAELVEMVLKGGRYGEAGPEAAAAAPLLGQRAHAGAGAVLAVRPAQVFAKLAESAARQLQLIVPRGTAVVAERHRLRFPRIRPEHKMRVAPRRLRRLHLKGVVVVRGFAEAA